MGGTPVTTPVITFNPTAFLARYPEFSSISTATLQEYFNEATLYVENSACSIVQDLNKLTMFLNMVTAHIAFLAGALTADGQTRPVGRVSQASQGSVSAIFDYNSATPGSGAWFAQSQYGVAFWQATTCYRGMRYVPQPTRVRGFTGNRLGWGWPV